jgi:hypothetical protein
MYFYPNLVTVNMTKCKILHQYLPISSGMASKVSCSTWERRTRALSMHLSSRTPSTKTPRLLASKQHRTLKELHRTREATPSQAPPSQY